MTHLVFSAVDALCSVYNHQKAPEKKILVKLLKEQKHATAGMRVLTHPTTNRPAWLKYG
jgi:hypothetical protein